MVPLSRVLLTVAWVVTLTSVRARWVRVRVGLLTIAWVVTKLDIVTYNYWYSGIISKIQLLQCFIMGIYGSLFSADYR